MICLKYRLFPTKGQERKLTDTLETCRHVYNSLLNWRKHDYEVLGKSSGRYDQQKAFPSGANSSPKWAMSTARFSRTSPSALTWPTAPSSAAWMQGEKPGFPRIKGDGYDSFCYPQSGFKVGESTVSLSLFGRQEKVKAKLHRPAVGRVKTCCIHRVGSKWFVCFSVEQEDIPLPPLPDAVGLDAGLNSFLALSNGEFVDNPRFFRKDEKALAKAQRRLAKQTRGSRARRKAKKVVSRIHERIRNRRHDFVHQTARRLVNRFGVIAVEKLNVKNMLGNHCLAKSIADASWSMFRTVLTSKAESAGREVIAVNPAYTSQDCHACGYRAKKKLSERWHLCPMCGATLDRDTNAAINILDLATSLGQHSVG